VDIDWRQSNVLFAEEAERLNIGINR
jgi:hypothetical protein